MQEVEGVLNGTFNYAYLKGDTGPLVLVEKLNCKIQQLLFCVQIPSWVRSHIHIALLFNRPWIQCAGCTMDFCCDIPAEFNSSISNLPSSLPGL